MTDVVEVMARAMAAWDRGPDAFDKAFPPTRNMFLGLSRAALAALEAAGWVVVPREPTAEMLEAGTIPTLPIVLGNGAITKGFGLGADQRTIWSRMLAAAPRATQPERTPGIGHRQEPFEGEPT